MRTKKLKYAVISSVVAICVCLALLAGSTYAWFTDTLVSSGNVIEAGSVRVSADVYQPVEENGVTVKTGESNELEVYSIISRSKLTTTEGYEDLNGDDANYFVYGEKVTFSFDLEGDRTDLAKDGAIYNAEKEAPLEPGVSAPIARIIEVENTGSLEAAVKLSFSAAGNLVSDMWADVLPVKYTPAESDGGGSGGKDASILVDSTDAACEAISFSPKSMSDINASNDSEMILEPGESGYLLLIFGIYADCSNEANGQNFDLEVAVLATQSVGHHECDSGIQAEFPDWDGTSVDTGWYDPADATYEFTIYTGAELAGFAEIVNETEHYSGGIGNVTRYWTVTLGADIDLENQPWTPIGYDNDHAFEGTFDGAGHTISNLNVTVEKTMTSNDANTGCGLFGYIAGGTVKDLTIHNVKSTGRRLVGTLAGVAACYVYDQSDPHLHIDNCHVTGLIEVSGYHQVGGLVGVGEEALVTDCSVEGVSGSYVRSTYAVDEDSDDVYNSDYDGDAAGGLIGWAHTAGSELDLGSGETEKIEKAQNDMFELSGCLVSGLEISGCRKVGGLIGHTSGSVDYSGCSVKECDISLVYNEAYSGNLDDGTAKLFVGAIVGEFEWVQQVSGNCYVTNVSVSYLADNGVTGNYTPTEEEENPYTGLFGGSRNQAVQDSTEYSKVTYNESCSVVAVGLTLTKIGTNGLPV